MGDIDRYANNVEQEFGPQPTRDTNATVENWMKLVKKDTLCDNLRLKPGVYARKMHQTLKGRIKEYWDTNATVENWMKYITPMRQKFQEYSKDPSPIIQDPVSDYVELHISHVSCIFVIIGFQMQVL